jgi:hypothetical protein
MLINRFNTVLLRRKTKPVTNSPLSAKGGFVGFVPSADHMCSLSHSSLVAWSAAQLPHADLSPCFALVLEFIILSPSAFKTLPLRKLRRGFSFKARLVCHQFKCGSRQFSPITATCANIAGPEPKSSDSFVLRSAIKPEVYPLSQFSTSLQPHFRVKKELPQAISTLSSIC